MNHYTTRAAEGAREPSVRESYLCFPAWTQPIWTRLTGKPLPNDRPATPLPVLLVMGWDLCSMVLVGALQLRLLTSFVPDHVLAGCILTPVLAIYLTGRLRKAQVVYGHHAIHGTLFRQRGKFNAFAACALTIFALAQRAPRKTARTLA